MRLTRSRALAVAATQLTLLWRERRLLWLASAVLLLAAASVATSAARLQAQALERLAVTQQEARLWDSQGVIDPHNAAHVGRAVPAPVRPLAVFDPGISDFVGASVFIEGHAQNPAQHRPVEAGAALSRFGGFSAAWTLQVVAPLLIILAGFTTLSGVTARERIRQELGAGASAASLVWGRLIALGAAGGLLGFVLVGVSVPAVMAQGGGADELVGLAALLGAYVIYLLAFCGITVGVSGLFASSRIALVVLLGFWAVATVLAPRLAPAVGEALSPTPSAPEFRAAVVEEAENGVDGHDSADVRLDALKSELLARYAVAEVDDLPINFRGVALSFAEKNSSDTYNRHFARLHATYRRQDRLQRLFSALSPTLAVQPWSRAFARTDIDAHLTYLQGVEAYRYSLVQTLNREVTLHKAPLGERYQADIARVTRSVVYKPREVGLPDVVRAQAPNLAILAGWMLAGLGLATVSALHLGRRS